MSKVLVSLDQILSDDLKGRIKEVDEKIRKFLKLLNSEFSLDHQIPILETIITRENHYVYEDDGNTRTDGFKYDVYWIFPIGQNIEPRNYYYYRIINNLACNCLYFHYEDKERIRDKKSNGSGRFLSLYISVEKLEYPLSEDKEVKRISYENDNYKLGWCINYLNAMNCILEIKEYQKREDLLSELKETELLDS